MSTRRVVHFKFVIVALAIVFIAGFVVCAEGWTDQAHAAAATYYVDSTRPDDTGDGLTEGTAWKTATKVESAQTGGTIKAGDTVLFKRGGSYTGNLTVTVTGTAGNVLTFGAYGTGAKPIIDGSAGLYAVVFTSMNYVTFNDLQVQNATADGFRFRTANDHVTFNNIDVVSTPIAFDMTAGAGTFSNITITNCTTNATVARAIYFTGMTSLSTVTLTGNSFQGQTTAAVAIAGPAATASGITINNTTVNNSTGVGIDLTTVSNVVISNTTTTNSSSHGLRIAGDSDTIDIDNLTSTTNGDSGIYINGSTSVNGATIDNSTFNNNGNAEGDNGVSVLNTTDSITFTNSTANNNSGDGFNVHNASTNIVFDHCTADTNGADGVGSDGDGFSYHETSTGTIKYSIAKNNLKTAIGHINSSVVNMYNNLFTHATSSTQPFILLTGGTHILKNNVIYVGAQTGSVLDIAGGTATVQDNIIMGGAYGFYKENTPTITADHNLVYGAATDSYYGISAGANDVNLDPKFVAPGTDFHLQSTSPAIDAGLDTSIATDYVGKQRYDDPGVTNTGSGTADYYDIGAYEYVTPPIPSVTSLTHPLQTSWYFSNMPAIAVSPTSSTTSYRYLINQTAVPLASEVQAGTASASGAFSVLSGTINADGVWYIHMIGQNLDGDFSSNYSTYTIQYDATSPTVSASLTPATPNGDGGSYATKPSITLSATDATSGVSAILFNWDLGANQTYSSGFQAQEGTHVLYCYAIDKAGNLSATTSAQIIVDTSSPVDFVASVRTSTGSPAGAVAENPVATISEPLGNSYTATTTGSQAKQKTSGGNVATTLVVTGGSLLVVGFGLWKLGLRRFW